MMKLTDRKWKEFTLEDIFIIKSGKRLESYNFIDGLHPFIGATDNNNGLTAFISNDNNSKDKNVLGVNYNGAPCISFYHPYECLFTDDVKRFHLKEVADDKYIFLFFKSVILQQKKKYSYAYKFNENRMKRQIILVPVDKNGKPDYKFMHDFMFEKYNSYAANGKEYYANLIKKIKYADVLPINEKTWKEFSIEDICNVSGTITTKPEELVKGGKIPRITCSSENNGLDDFYQNKATEKGNVITIDSATVGFVSYQKTDFIATDHVEKLSFDSFFNVWIGLFIKTAIDNSVNQKYGYGYKFSQTRIKRQIIKLPVNDAGNPDYEYMEQYIKNMIIRKCKEYLNFKRVL